MRFRWTKHAHEQAIRRGISRPIAEDIVERPDRKRISRRGKQIAIRHFTYQSIEVVFRQEDEIIVVITVYKKTI